MAIIKQVNQQNLDEEDAEMLISSPRKRGDSPLFSWNNVSLRAAKTWRSNRKFRFGIALALVIVAIMNCVSMYKYYFDIEETQYVWKADADLRTYFRPILTESDTSDMIGILDVFVNTLERFNISYLMYSGTLIGSWRHMGCIPWDDDLDVMVNYTDRERVKVALDTLQPKYKLYTGFIWKLYLDDGSRPYRAWWERLGRWRWPFVDIFFYTENATHIWDTKEWLKDFDIYKKVDVFPLRKRPYENLWLYAPKDTQAVLDVNFNTSDCVTNDMSHKTQMAFSRTKRIPCLQLNMQYPFVRREHHKNATTKEVLAFGNGTVVRTVYL
ncbi:lipopolysaccharide cholinephosphotransferase LicD-like [Lineus longissimus]|uniref:lipopolysaccharide cholinephosphotransferase LicD-like n=1 Tax=Lineus longissimus TaxID=88925 RepID=UPI00315DC8C7